MNDVIYKYDLDLSGPSTRLRVPTAFHILSVGEDRFGNLCVWIQMAADAEAVRELSLAVIGTGMHFRSEKHGRYIGTACMRDGYVWHVFYAFPE